MINFALGQRRARIVLTVGATILSGCATVSTGPTTTPTGPTKGPAVTAPSLGLFSSIKVPSDREAVLQLSAKGVQVFRCEKRNSGYAWVFRQPDAELIDANGQVVGRHGANFSFEHVDGSRLVATIAAYDDAPKSTDLRWLLLTTRSYGKGAFDSVTHVQRVNTHGGMPPERCESSQVNQVLRVDFTSDFVFYRTKSSASG